ncbi:MAG TPA: 50S ribosomal protein P1 [Candidatus Nitrosopolaris sp.]|nr:50S ribosomal protein P1 [Candidatus Nitrosopolaris sp.]
MEYIYAALLLHKLKQEVTEANITNVIKSTGVTPNGIQVKALVAALSEVNIDEALKAAPVALSSSPASAGPPSPATAESKVEEEKKEEKKEEEALEGLSALFG